MSRERAGWDPRNRLNLTRREHVTPREITRGTIIGGVWMVFFEVGDFELGHAYRIDSAKLPPFKVYVADKTRSKRVNNEEEAELWLVDQRWEDLVAAGLVED